MNCIDTMVKNWGICLLKDLKFYNVETHEGC